MAAPKNNGPCSGLAWPDDTCWGSWAHIYIFTYFEIYLDIHTYIHTYTHIYICIFTTTKSFRYQNVGTVPSKAGLGVGFSWGAMNGAGNIVFFWAFLFVGFLKVFYIFAFFTFARVLEYCFFLFFFSGFLEVFLNFGIFTFAGVLEYFFWFSRGFLDFCIFSACCVFFVCFCFSVFF